MSKQERSRHGQPRGHGKKRHAQGSPRRTFGRATTGGTRSGGEETATAHKVEISGVASPGMHGVGSGGMSPTAGMGGTGTGAGGLATSSASTGGTRNRTRRAPGFPITPEASEGIPAGSLEEDVQFGLASDQAPPPPNHERQSPDSANVEDR